MKNLKRIIAVAALLACLFSVMSVPAFAASLTTNINIKKNSVSVDGSKDKKCFEIDFDTQKNPKKGNPTVKITNTGAYALHVLSTYKYGRKNIVITPGCDATIVYDKGVTGVIKIQFDQRKNDSFDLFIPRWLYNGCRYLFDRGDTLGSFKVEGTNGIVSGSFYGMEMNSGYFF